MDKDTAWRLLSESELKYMSEDELADLKEAFFAGYRAASLDKVDALPKSRIFSGDYSKDMWDDINNAASVEDLQRALYFVCCRLQELESRMYKRATERGGE